MPSSFTRHSGMSAVAATPAAPSFTAGSVGSPAVGEPFTTTSWCWSLDFENRATTMSFRFMPETPLSTVRSVYRSHVARRPSCTRSPVSMRTVFAVCIVAASSFCVRST